MERKQTAGAAQSEDARAASLGGEGGQRKDQLPKEEDGHAHVHVRFVQRYAPRAFGPQGAVLPADADVADLLLAAKQFAASYQGRALCASDGSLASIGLVPRASVYEITLDVYDGRPARVTDHLLAIETLAGTELPWAREWLARPHRPAGDPRLLTVLPRAAPLGFVLRLLHAPGGRMVDTRSLTTETIRLLDTTTGAPVACALLVQQPGSDAAGIKASHCCALLVPHRLDDIRPDRLYALVINDAFSGLEALFRGMPTTALRFEGRRAWFLADTSSSSSSARCVLPGAVAFLVSFCDPPDAYSVSVAKPTTSLPCT